MTIHQQAALEFLSLMSGLICITYTIKAIWPTVKRNQQWREIK